MGGLHRPADRRGTLAAELCGQTTSLKMVNRLIEPTSGRILIDGEEAARRDMTQLRRGSATSSSRSACSRTRRSASRYKCVMARTHQARFRLYHSRGIENRLPLPYVVPSGIQVRDEAAGPLNAEHAFDARSSGCRLLSQLAQGMKVADPPKPCMSAIYPVEPVAVERPYRPASTWRWATSSGGSLTTKSAFSMPR